MRWGIEVVYIVDLDEYQDGVQDSYSFIVANDNLLTGMSIL